LSTTPRQRLAGAPLWAVALCAALFNTGCAQFSAGAPAPALPTLGLTETEGFSAAIAAPAPTEADLHWWRRFDDPALALWVERALANNVDIAIATERVKQARALLQSAQAGRGVSLGVQAATELRLQREAGQRRVQPDAALTLDFDMDLWGGLRQAERSAAAGVLRNQDLAQAARLAAAGLTARAYIEWRVALKDHRLLGDALTLQREALRIVLVRVGAGLSPVLDRDRAQAEVAATQAEQASAAQRIGQAVAALQVLAGQRPRPPPLSVVATSSAAGEDRLKLPALQGLQPLVRPLDLLRLRPDLGAAEQALVAAAADIGVAQAALRPQLRLPGTLVFGAATASAGVFELVSATLAAVLDVTLFDSGAGAAALASSRSRAREAALVYRQTLLQALQQVEGALLAQQGAQARIAARQSASTAALTAEAQAQTLYRAGLTGFLDVLDTQRSALVNQRELLQAQADSASAAVVAFEAMGMINSSGGALPGS
jgi:NodT family efflux transporter outer membrane factor (OMF) lipoprotein